MIQNNNNRQSVMLDPVLEETKTLDWEMELQISLLCYFCPNRYANVVDSQESQCT